MLRNSTDQPQLIRRTKTIANFLKFKAEKKLKLKEEKKDIFRKIIELMARTDIKEELEREEDLDSRNMPHMDHA